MLATLAAQECIAYAQRKRADEERAMLALAEWQFKEHEESKPPRATEADRQDAARQAAPWLYVKRTVKPDARPTAAVCERHIAVLADLPPTWSRSALAAALGVSATSGHLCGLILRLEELKLIEHVGRRDHVKFYVVTDAGRTAARLSAGIHKE